MSKLKILTAGLPSAKGPFDYIQEQGKYVLLGLMIYAFIKYYKDEKWGKMTISGIAGGIVLMFIGAPDMVGNALKAVGNLFMPQ
ncbi:hypothetical protein I6N96_12735 [Enterococcus sp. BWM-S5]|uniref:Conjugal transfer protein n=1 Tax=Enterococcus larvae TaxID=2794352 RepID=A0ABS4CM74_9ENTE|nr:TcpD family membrane protein [Enterococcus larvae]MBP1047140.1 hypothetical protein [Enterococcus larvae]